MPFSFLGPTLLSASGDTIPASQLPKSKVVGLYFSASWCLPCKVFTPTLIKTYELKHGSGFEVVYVSSDKSEEQFKTYFATMPWLALPYEDRARKAKLSSRYKVRGIPMLILLDADGRVITNGGRQAVTEDPEGLNFPWRPRSVHEVLGDSFLNAGGAYVGSEAVAGKTLALYFSASWCGPCKKFTPQLAQTYSKLRAAGRADFEFVFVSSDRDEASFSTYRATMPWLALPFERRDAQAELSRMFEITGIPTLVTLNSDGSVVNRGARSAADADPEGLGFPWAPQPLADLTFGTECMGHDINDRPSLIVLMEGADDLEQREISGALAPVAAAAAAAAASGEELDEEHGMLFFVARSSGGVVPQIRRLLGLPAHGTHPYMVVLDIPAEGSYYPFTGREITAESIKTFVADYKEGKLERRQLGG